MCSGSGYMHALGSKLNFAQGFFYYYFNTQPKLCHGDVRGTVTDLKVDFCPINKKCLFKKYFTITFHSISHGINFK